MLNGITFGQYYPGNSMLHRLDPRSKIIFTMAYLFLVFMVKSFIGFAVLGVFLAVIIKGSGVPFKQILRSLKPLLFILIFTFTLNLFFSSSGKIIFELGFIRISEGGLYQAIFISLRLALMIMGTSLLTFTTSPILLTDGMEKLLSPLGKIGFPSHEMAMMMTIALRFIPTLMDEADKIMKAQMARGADFESGNIFKRAKSMIPLLVPLFINSFRRADELAMAMEARCYTGGKGRTRMRVLKFGKDDIMASAIFIIAGAIILVV